MKIMLVSRSWPAYEKSGVSLAAQKHANILIAAGHELYIVGSNPLIAQESTPAAGKFYVPSSGSSALYAPAKLDRQLFQQLISKTQPDLVILEAWQTGLTEGALKIAHQMHIPILMISHGISIHPYSNTLRNWLRYLAWLPYQYLCLRSQIEKLTAITALDLSVESPRFYDRDLAQSLHKPVYPLTNAPALKVASNKTRAERKNQILNVGYFSEVKNQLRALTILKTLPNSISMLLVGKKEGSYYQACEQYVVQNQLEQRVAFREDHQVDLAMEFSQSMILLQTSITEALPITLLEAMASGTPFVATPVGAAISLQGGLHAKTFSEQVLAVEQMFGDERLWKKLSAEGKTTFEQHFTDAKVREQLCHAVENTMSLG